MSTAATRILHLHIEKTGGTALRFALLASLGPGAKRFPHHHENRLEGIVPDEWDLISGHFGYGKLAPLGGRVIALLRDPVDRFVSVYYYWREMHRRGVEQSRKTALATNYPLDEFVKIKDDVALIEQYFNRMTWQLADSAALPQRHVLRATGITDAALLALATHNLKTCAVVGIQERMDDFAAGLNRRLGLDVQVQRLNVTEDRPPVSDVPAETKRRIHEWLYLDTELYQSACVLAARG